RDGTPFLAQYTIGRGKLFVSAAPLADRYSNFALSTIFVPILYKMAIQNSAQQVYTQNIGDNQPLWMPMKAMDSRTVIYMRGEGFEGIPAQQPSGSGLNVYAADKAQQPGFYNLHAAQTKDSIWVGMNI